MKSFLWVLFRCKFQFKLKRYLQEKKNDEMEYLYHYSTFAISP